MLFCRASLPLPRQTLNFAAGIIRRHRISIGSLWLGPRRNGSPKSRLALLRVAELANLLERKPAAQQRVT